MQKVGIIHKGRNVMIGVLRERLKDGIAFHEVFPEVDRINTAKGSSLRVISPQVADTLVTTPDGPWRYVRDGSPFFTNAALAYESKGKPLGRHILLALESTEENEDRLLYVLATGKYRGEKGIALLVPDLTAADFKRVDDCLIRIDVPDSRLVVVRAFPDRGARYYLPYFSTTIPHGTEVGISDPQARYLIKRETSYVGPVVRCVGGVEGMAHARQVSVDYGPSAKLGVLVVIPEKDLPKFA